MTGYSHSPGSYDRSGRRVRAAIVVVTICLVFGLSWAGFSWAGHHRTAGGGPKATSETSSAGTPSPRGQVPTVPSRPPSDPAEHGAGLAGIKWTDFHGAELPVSVVAGPRVSQDGVVWGFADSRLGALLAAVNIAVRANAQWGPRVFGPVIRTQVIGPATGLLLRNCGAVYDRERRAAGLPDGAPLGPLVVVIRAFRWVSYRPSSAVVDVVSAAPSGTGRTALAVTWVAVRWQRGDWRVVAPPGGSWGNAAAQLAFLSGYTTFPDPPA